MALPDPIFAGRNNCTILGQPSAGIDRYPTLPPIAFPNLAAWYRFTQGITIATGASAWADASGNGRNLLQGTAGAQPLKQTDGSLLFDGVDDFMIVTGGFTLNQPATVYLLLKQVTWTNTEVIADGNTSATGAILQAATTPNLKISAGSAVAENSGLALGSYLPIAAVFNGASSSLTIDRGAPTTGNAGAGNMGGFTLGAAGGGAASWSNIQVKEAALFSAAHDANTIQRIFDYLRSL